MAVAAVATPDELHRAPGTVGRPPVGCTVAVYDENRRKVTEPGNVGTVFVSNGLSFSGYTDGGNKEIVEGLLSTGDTGHFDETGLWFIDGRDDNVIVSGGENVFPLEVENLLADHPDIVEASVVGVDDAEFGKRLAAYVVIRPGSGLDADAVKSLAYTGPTQDPARHGLRQAVAARRDRQGSAQPAHRELDEGGLSAVSEGVKSVSAFLVLPRARRYSVMRVNRRMLSNKVVVVTGAANGIGAQLSRDLVGVGARVALLDRDVPCAQRLAAELGSGAAVFEADVTSAESTRAACDAAARHFGAVDVVVANAGIAGPGSSVAAVDPADWRQVVDVNLVGAFHTLHAALPHLKASGGYAMVVASIAAVIPGPLVSAYMASKAGVESLVRATRIEVAGDGVGVGIAYFGLIDTGLADQMLTRSGLAVVLPGPLGRLAPVEAATSAITAGIARRARRVYAPWWVAPMLDLRPLLFLADRLLAVLPSLRRAVHAADQEEVR